MYKSVLAGVGLVALVAGSAQAAPRSLAAPWVITPADSVCRTELELTGRAGATAPVTLASDGERIVLRFAKEELPERAFLPIRIDQKPYSNIMRRGPDGAGEITLSETTEAALRKGATLSIAWLMDEPVSAALAGSEQGVPDLKTCGAQVAGEARARWAAEADAKARAETDARAQAIADAQLQAAQAQTAAADAERQRQEADAQRLRAQADAADAQADRDRQAAAYAAGQRAYQEAQRYQEGPRYEEEPQPALPPQPIPYRPGPPPWAYRRY